MTRLSSLLSSVGMSAVLAGCFADRTPPEGLPCSVESDCPDTHTCRVALGTCVAIAGLDAVPPALTDVVITPAVASFSDEVRVTFTSEPLLDPPVLTTDTDDLSFTLAGNDGESWTFTALVDLNASDGGSHEINADLLDEAGNAARIAVGSVTLDFEAPELSSCTFDPPSVSLSDDSDLYVDIEIVFFETDLRVLDLELVGRPPANVAFFLEYELATHDDETYVIAHYQKTGTEPPGTYEIVYVVQDAVGNTANAIGCSLPLTP